MRPPVALLALVLGACSVNVDGARCRADADCPTGQVCGTAGTCATSVPLREGCLQVTSLLAARVAECFGGDRDVYLAEADQTGLCDSIASSGARGALAYHDDRLRACKAEVATASCETLSTGSLDFRASCPAIEPRLKDGGACSSSYECPGSDFCDASETCPGTCRRLRVAGEACTVSIPCGPGLQCAGGLCRSVATRGQACGNGVRCDASTYCASGTCQPLVAEGQPCTPSLTDPPCALRTSCRGPSGAQTCRRVVDLGGACTPGSYECGFLLYCAVGSATCVSYPRAGATCGLPDGLVSGSELVLACVGARCADGSCQAPLALGAACTTDLDCALGSAYCDGVCRPRYCAR